MKTPEEHLFAILHQLVTLTVQGKLVWKPMSDSTSGMVGKFSDYEVYFYPKTGSVFAWQLVSMGFRTVFDITLNTELSRQLESAIPRVELPLRNNSVGWVESRLLGYFLSE